MFEPVAVKRPPRDTISSGITNGSRPGTSNSGIPIKIKDEGIN